MQYQIQGETLPVVICQLSDTGIRIYTCFCEDFVCCYSANSIDISQTNLYTLFSR